MTRGTSTTTKAAAKDAAEPKTPGELEDRRDTLAAAADDKASDLADARAAAVAGERDSHTSAVDAARDAAEAQADVDRKEQSIRAGGFTTKDLATKRQEPHGVVSDATGGPYADRPEVREAKMSRREARGG